MFFAQVSTDPIEIFILPALALFFGSIVYFFGARRELIEGEVTRWKWIGVGILSLGVLVAFPTFWDFVDPGADGAIYRELNNGRKSTIAHIGGFALPFLAVLTAIGHHFYTKRRDRTFM